MLYEHLPRLMTTSALLTETASPGSSQYLLAGRLESARTSLLIALLDFFHRDHCDRSLSASIENLRGILAEYAKSPLTAAKQRRLRAFECAFGSFGETMKLCKRLRRTSAKK